MAYFKKGEWEESEKSLTLALNCLGEKNPTTKIGIRYSIIKEFIIHILRNFFQGFQIRKECNTKENNKEIVMIYFMLNWMYALSGGEKFFRTVIRGLNIADIRIGKSKELVLLLGHYSLLLVLGFEIFSRSKKYLDKAITIGTELGDEWGVAQSLEFFAFFYDWHGEYHKSIEYFIKSNERLRKIGDMWTLSTTVQVLGLTYLYLGSFRDSLNYLNQCLKIGYSIKDNFGISAAYNWTSLVYAQKDEFDNAEEWCRKSLKLSEDKKIWFVFCYSCATYGFLEIRRHRWTDAIRYLEKAQDLNERNTFLTDYVIQLYPWLAEACLGDYLDKFNKGELDKRTRNRYLKKIKEAAKKALKKTRNWPNHYGSALLAYAKYCAISGQKGRAERYFKKSIEQAGKIGRKYVLGRAYFEYGNFLKSRNKEESAYYNWQKAHKIFREIGSREYVRECGELLGYGNEEAKVPEELTPLTNAQGRLKTERRLNAVITTGRSLSSILDMEELLEKIVDCTIELTGAERGVLFLYPEDREEDSELEIKVTRNIEKVSEEEEKFLVSRSVIRRVIAEKKAIIIEDAAFDEDLSSRQSVVISGLRSILCSPIIVRGEILGVIYLDNRLVSGLFTKEDLMALDLISSQAGISIENARLYRKAIMDGLTGLYNRIFFDNYLLESIKNVLRYNKRISLLMIDVDQFK
ncbi:MAG: GAF domain-containing protein, partial [Candidatus Firestonebacteria bacterium]